MHEFNDLLISSGFMTVLSHLQRVYQNDFIYLKGYKIIRYTKQYDYIKTILYVLEEQSIGS